MTVEASPVAMGAAVWFRQLVAPSSKVQVVRGLAANPSAEFSLWTAQAILTVSDNSAANPSVVTVDETIDLALFPIGSTTPVRIQESDSTPVIDGDQVATIIGANSFSVPVNVTLAGADGQILLGAVRLTEDFAAAQLILPPPGPWFELPANRGLYSRGNAITTTLNGVVVHDTVQ